MTFQAFHDPYEPCRKGDFRENYFLKEHAAIELFRNFAPSVLIDSGTG